MVSTSILDRERSSSTPATVFRGAVVAPVFAHDPAWPWLTTTPPLDRCEFEFVRIRNQLRHLRPATALYRRMQHGRAARRIQSADVAFLFSVDIAVAVASRRADRSSGPRLVYVGFTQDGRWSPRRLRVVGRSLRACDVVTAFTEAERRQYVERYDLDPARIHVLPIHTDDMTGYRSSEGPPPHSEPYVLALGVTNRIFTPTARACRDLNVPLVVLTRPSHRHDDLDELRSLGAIVHTDADQKLAWRYMRHARTTVMQFADPDLPCGFTTVINAMFLGTPVIAGESVGMNEHVESGRTGLIVRRDDDAGLRLAIESVWSDERLACSLGSAALDRARERHSIEAAAPRFHDVACGVMERGIGC